MKGLDVTFPAIHWSVAARSAEIGHGPTARTTRRPAARRVLADPIAREA